MKKLIARIKKNIKSSLEKLAEENKKQFAGKKLDCCTINRKPVRK